jgi:hypothetical protein
VCACPSERESLMNMDIRGLFINMVINTFFSDQRNKS